MQQGFERCAFVGIRKDQLAQLAALELAIVEGQMDERAITLAERFWPGPLTLVVPVADSARTSELARAGLGTIGLRVPNHRLALALLEWAGAGDAVNRLLSPLTVWTLGLPVAVGMTLIFGVMRKELTLVMLVQALAGQLRGRVEVGPGPGSRIRVWLAPSRVPTQRSLGRSLFQARARLEPAIS